MTEGQWLACDEPQAMMDLLGREASNRKLRLFAVTCCRRLWQYLDDEKGRPALEAAEQGADGGVYGYALWAALAIDIANYDELRARIAEKCGHRREVGDAVYKAVALSMDVRGCEEAKSIALRVAQIAVAQALGSRGDDYLLYQLGKDIQLEDEDFLTAERVVAVEKAAQVVLLRDIFGNPFRPITFAPAWRTSDVMLLAQGIYDERAFDRMPILADALQDAGCDSDDILDHCRDARATHVRGCWVVDLVLGKS